MLSQARPKSQPPIKFNDIVNGTGGTIKQKVDGWGELIDRFKPSSVATNGKFVDKSNELLEELSSPSSSSSSSSLASSSLSISTNSSTSTVLAALNSINIHRSKSMISRFSSSVQSGYKQSSKVSTVDEDDQKVSRGQQKKQVSADKDDEEEDAHQMLSSSSSTSSSSGLSSMNSSSNNGRNRYPASGYQRVSEAVCHDDVDQNVVKQNCEEEEEEEAEVGKCLKQLVCLVADKTDNDLGDYASFQLHEAVPAKTRSTTTTSGSSDEDAEISINRIRLQNETLAISSAKSYLVCKIKIDAPTNIIQMVRNYVDSLNISENLNYIVYMKPKESSIEWRQVRKGQQIERIPLGHILDCLVEDNLVIWLLVSRDDHQLRCGNGNLIDQSETTLELETTLDDIALALDEPIKSQENDFKQNKHDNSASPVEALVWLCSTEEEAMRFKQTYKFLMANSNLSKRKHEIDDDELEVQLNKIVGKKQVADCSYRGVPVEDETGKIRDDDDDDGGDHRQLSNQHLDYRRLTGARSVGIANDLVSGNMSASQLATSGRGNKRNQPQQQLQQTQMKPMGESEITSTISSNRVDQTKQRMKSGKLVDQRSGATATTVATANVSHDSNGRLKMASDGLETPVSSSTSSVSSSLMMPTNNDRKVKTKSLSGETGKLANGFKQQVKSSQVVTGSSGNRSKFPKATAMLDVAASDKQQVKLQQQQQQSSRLKKSASGLDLSASSSTSSSGLASYYRNMASKVISNGQIRIKSFRDEMIKLNNRMPVSSSSTSISATSSTSSSSKFSSSSPSSSSSSPSSSCSSSSPVAKQTVASGTSQIDKSSSRQNCCGQQANNSRHLTSSNESECNNLSFLNEYVDNKSSNRNEKAQTNVVIPVGKQQGHQHAGFGISEAVSLDNNLADQVPVIKPRTSILKNKQQQNNGCDINNNNNYSKIELLRKQHNNNNNNNDQQIAGEKGREHYRFKCDTASSSSSSSSAITKPKSILKTSKSVSNILNDEEQAISSYRSSFVREGDYEDDDDGAFAISSNGGSLEEERRRKEVIQQLPLNQSKVKFPINDNDQQVQSAANRAQRRYSTSENQTIQCQSKLANNNTILRRQPVDNNLEKRRSTYSMANEHYVDNHIREEGGESIRLNGGKDELAFERLKQRASCYDISRLMSKNGLQNQLNKLRSGSTNSINGKSRQRRPALLLDDSKELEDGLIGEGEQVTVMNSSNNRLMNGAKTTSSGADGTVRAKVSAAQLVGNNRSSIGENGLATANWSSYEYSPGEVALAQGGRRQQQQQQQQSARLSIVKGTKSSDDNSIAHSAKKSEFDPRSLRRLPTNSSHNEYNNRQQSIAGGKSAPSRQLVDVRSSGRKEDSSKVVDEKVALNEREQALEQAKDQSNSTASVADDSSTEDESSNQVSSTPSLSKSGPFNLLRQSFNQKTLSSMLKFSGRASLRIKAATAAAATATSTPENVAPNDTSKKSAIAIAEANLLAAKQLKQQAQKLKEQQKREQQQVPMDPAAMMLAAVQYNQQIQRQQQQQQQQQILYQQAQQYAAVATRGHMFDATSVQLQHQLLIQRQQQQQQIAYMANLSSAYMAQQMAAMSPAISMVPMSAAMPSQQLMYVQPPAPQVQAVQQQSSSIFRKSILKRSSKTPAVQSKQQMIYQSQVTGGQQMVPMAVNHHSSFNIVYTGHSSASSQIPQLQQPSYEEPAIQSAPPTKQSSLGASMRKTVRSILINRSSLNPSSTTNSESRHLDGGKQHKLKSALKSSTSNREIVLNSEGSDGDSSSSDSTAANTHKSQVVVLPKSALKKTSLDHQEISSTTSDSSCSSGNAHEYQQPPIEKKSPLVRGSEYHRQSAKFNSGRANQCHMAKPSGSTGRKNVTFSTKLTSIL